MTKAINVSLEEIAEWAKKIQGNKVYMVGKGKGFTDSGDVLISAIIDTNNVLFNSEEEFGFYGYKISDRVFFDIDKHPYWKAYFGKENFKLYDGMFLGHCGCGGHNAYVNIVKRAKADLSRTKDYKNIILRQFNDFNKRYLADKGKLIGNKIRAKFGLVKGETGDVDDFAQYLRYDEPDLCEDRDVLIFWRWFRNKFVDEEVYEKKVKETTKAEHEHAFRNYIDGVVLNLEHVGFKKAEK